jgi:hypothetical protein
MDKYQVKYYTFDDFIATDSYIFAEDINEAEEKAKKVYIDKLIEVKIIN